LRIVSKCSILIAVSDEVSHVCVAPIASIELGEVRFFTRTEDMCFVNNGLADKMQHRAWASIYAKICELVSYFSCSAKILFAFHETVQVTILLYFS